MDTSLITAILVRIKSHHKAHHAWMVVEPNEGWHINIIIRTELDDIDSTVASGANFSELPALLSSLK